MTETSLKRLCIFKCLLDKKGNLKDVTLGSAKNVQKVPIYRQNDRDNTNRENKQPRK